VLITLPKTVSIKLSGKIDAAINEMELTNYNIDERGVRCIVTPCEVTAKMAAPVKTGEPVTNGDPSFVFNAEFTAEELLVKEQFEAILASKLTARIK
jgi:hypothetical protein